MNILCKLGLHRWITKLVFEPSIHARTVTAYEDRTICTRCGKVKRIVRHEWIDNDFVEVKAHKTGQRL